MTVKVTGFFYGEKECLMGKSFFIVAALVLTLGCAKAQVDPVSSLNSVDFESITLEIGGKHLSTEKA